MSINLLTETKDELEMHGKTLNDIRWVGCYDYEIPLEQFMSLADKVYDNGFGGQKVAADLIVVGDDWWLERAEYEGAEWWEYKHYPTGLPKSEPYKQLSIIYGILYRR